MNANFVFPAQPSAPTPRPPPARKQEESAPRDSSALRASVLDAALELGIGSNSLVTDWMFNNAVDEEDENEVCINYHAFIMLWPFSFFPKILDNLFRAAVAGAAIDCSQYRSWLRGNLFPLYVKDLAPIFASSFISALFLWRNIASHVSLL